MHDVLNGWDDFLVAQLGAAAALLGLLFVAVSINLNRILKYSHLPTRALEVLITLLCVLVVCTCALAPGQSERAYGLEIGATGALTWVVQVISLASTRHSGYERPIRVLMNQLPPLPFVAAGVLMALGRPGAVYWIVPGVLLSVISSIYGAWILLVEIQR